MFDGRQIRSEAGPRLRAGPLTAPPRPLAVGEGTALFVDGFCRPRRGRIVELEILIGGEAQPVLAHGMPLPRKLEGSEYWWAIVDVGPVQGPRSVPLRLRARLSDGTLEDTSLGSLDLVPELEAPPVELLADPPTAPASASGPLVAVCMATFNPPIELFRRQIESIRSQSHGNWICLISDDVSSPNSVEAMREVIGADDRFRISVSDRRLGVYNNFERAVSLAPEQVEFIALSDQDDKWRGDKLERLIDAISDDALLVYSDMRIVSSDGEVQSDTYWQFRSNNHTDFGSLVLANTVTGGASMFRRSLLDDALPFPPPQGKAFHDHWLAQVAMARGPISYVDEPLYDYVQHDDAALGHLRANASGRYAKDRRERIRDAIRHAREQGRHPGWRRYYFNIFVRVTIAARVLQRRLGPSMAPDRRRTLAWIGDSPAGTAWLALRGVRSWFGHNETLGREWAMLSGIAWRRMAGFRAGARRIAAATPVRGAGSGSAQPTDLERAPRLVPDGGAERPLQPILVDYFTRDGSTLLMRLLASSPQIVVENRYPFERKYFAYLWRWAHLLDRQDWPEAQWNASKLGSLDQFREEALIGPPPWEPRLLIDPEPGEEGLARSCFERAWEQFSARARERSAARDRVDPDSIRYYAEKHLNTWLVPLDQLPRLDLLVILRDPRDTWVSIRSFNRRRGSELLGRDRVASDEDHIRGVIERQRERLRWIAGLLDDERVPVIRYESLVGGLEEVAADLGGRLGVDFDVDAVRADPALVSRHVSASSPQASIGRWRTELEPDVAERFSRELGPELRAVGFEA